MQIESGKYYRTRDGRKVGPMWYNEFYGDWTSDNCGGGWYSNGGSYSNPDLVIVSEWQDELADDMEWTEIKETEPKEYIQGRIETADASIDLAALAAQHCIKITVQVGEVIIEYDGRTQ